MANNEQQEGASDTIIGASVKVEGDLVSDGDIRIDGLVTGKIKTSKNLSISSLAKVEADIEAGNADLAGIIKGDIKIKDILNIQETGKVTGNISCGQLSIAAGAHFSGVCTMPEADTSIQEPLPEE